MEGSRICVDPDSPTAWALQNRDPFAFCVKMKTREPYSHFKNVPLPSRGNIYSLLRTPASRPVQM